MNTLTNEAVIEAFSLYGLGDVKDTPVYIKGDVDLNYKITTENHIYLLKYIVNPASIPQFEFLGLLHEFLRNKGVIVPKIYKTKKDSYVENSFILYEFIHGASKKDWTDREITSLAINFTHFLTALKEYQAPQVIKDKDDKYIKGGNIEYCYNVFKPQIHELSISNDIKLPILEMINTLYSIFPEFSSLPKQLIHGDLNEMNALFSNDTNVAIIDLALSYDPLVYDLGEFLYWYAFPWWTEEFNFPRFHLIIDTFQQNIKLTPIELKLLPYMIMKRSMMDIMLTLQYYWSHEGKVDIPKQRLAEQIKRNNTIMKLVRKL